MKQNYSKTKERRQVVIVFWMCNYTENQELFDKTKHRQPQNEITDAVNEAYIGEI